MFCVNCGEKLPDYAEFCHLCGTAITNAMPKAEKEPAKADIKVGFSEKIYHPAIQSAMKKNKKATGVFGIILILIPVVVGFVISVQKDDFKNLLYGAAVGAIFLLFNLISAAKKKGEKQWDGIVADKRKVSKQEHKTGDSANYSTYNVYITKFKTDSGKTKKLEERDHSRYYYDYLEIGDKVRYHPQFNCYYEKYDKTKDSLAICPVCGRINDINKDVCAGCNVPVIK